VERKWWTLIAVSIATFMLLLDITVVNVALRSIRRHLGVSFTDLQWVFDAYALTLAALAFDGRLARRPAGAPSAVRRRAGNLLRRRQPASLLSATAGTRSIT
jgi:MFS family permease